MSYSVSVRIRKARDYSNEIKDVIIFALPGVYKVIRQELNDLDQCGTHVFEFENEKPASNFAKSLLGTQNNILDVTTSFELGW